MNLIGCCYGVLVTVVMFNESLSPNFDVFQSAYKRHHSTETALLKLTDVIFTRFTDHRSTILVSPLRSTASTIRC